MTAQGARPKRRVGRVIEAGAVMMLSTRCSAVLLALLAPMPLLAAPPSFSASDPRHAALYRLEEAASELYNSEDYALSMSQRTRDAWQRLHDVAVKARANRVPEACQGCQR